MIKFRDSMDNSIDPRLLSGDPECTGIGTYSYRYTYSKVAGAHMIMNQLSTINARIMITLYRLHCRSLL